MLFAFKFYLFLLVTTTIFLFFQITNNNVTKIKFNRINKTVKLILIYYKNQNLISLSAINKFQKIQSYLTNNKSLKHVHMHKKLKYYCPRCCSTLLIINPSPSHKHSKLLTSSYTSPLNKRLNSP
jgi:hypothetical protein